MSKLFFDHILILDDVEKEINQITRTEEERHELWHIVDDIVHHRVLDVIFEHLAEEHHLEFLDKYHQSPYDEALTDYLSEKIGENIEELIKQELGGLASEILEEIQAGDVVA